MSNHLEHLTASLNLAGLLLGLALYGLLFVLALRVPRLQHVETASRGRPRWRGWRQSTFEFDPLPVATGLLGAVWNAGAILTYGFIDFGLGEVPALLKAVAFTALGFLPAVAAHSVLRTTDTAPSGGRVRTLLRAGYVLSAWAGAIQLREAWLEAPMPSPEGLRLLMLGFLALSVPMAWLSRRQASWRRALWVTGLAIFAVSALHLSMHVQFNQPWPIEVLGHHASLPLALAILSQDYPFAVLDQFLKRALAIGGLVFCAFVAFLALNGSPLSARVGRDLDDPLAVLAFLALAVTSGLLYPWLRRQSAAFVDSIVLKRADVRETVANVGRLAQVHESTAALLDAVCRELAGAIPAPGVRWVAITEPVDAVSAEDSAAIGRAQSAWEASSGTVLITVARDARRAVVIVPTSDPPVLALVIGPLAGGRRLLSTDISMLEGVSLVLARRVDVLRFTQERFEQHYREQEISRLATVAELRALRAQINPHFLFNSLTTIGHLIQTAPPRALQTLLRLTELLRRVLRSEGEMTLLGGELAVVNAYLDIERARFEERLRVVVDVPSHLHAIAIPSFTLQPLVENAVKHGVAASRTGGTVTISARISSSPASTATAAVARALVLTVSDTGRGDGRGDQSVEGEGVGLSNVQRRLALCYGAAAGVRFDRRPGQGTSVEIHIPLESRVAIAEDAKQAVSTAP